MIEKVLQTIHSTFKCSSSVSRHISEHVVFLHVVSNEVSDVLLGCHLLDWFLFGNRHSACRGYVSWFVLGNIWLSSCWEMVHSWGFREGSSLTDLGRLSSMVRLLLLVWRDIGLEVHEDLFAIGSFVENAFWGSVFVLCALDEFAIRKELFEVVWVVVSLNKCWAFVVRDSVRFLYEGWLKLRLPFGGRDLT